ncbi:pilus assembly protein [Aquabacterium sp.]|uniref:pilus assembly protein n=1 Tax=Aquabacterium sp. TaxID=1872578 RepID=UPI003783374C
MKIALQLATSLLALGGLLFQATSHATDLAELPLKASVLAKPNVIFGMDDSGSMDSELMMYNNDGAFWWRYDTASGWGVDAAHPNPSLRTITSTWFNAAGNADATWRKLVYLFPNGQSTGNRVYADASYDHFAIMPTTQFAFLRWSGAYKDTAGVYQMPPSDPAVSPVHNPIYYNPLVTYKPWAPAQLSSGAITPADATPSATKSHLVLGGTTFDLTTSIASNTNANTVFTALPGMKIPSGAKKMLCNSTNGSCGSWSAALTADENASTSNVTRVAMSYYPATYWVKESCTVPSTVSVGTDDCTTAPDGSTLKRYEIKSGNTFPSGRSYAAELQNFANWFQYYRKRKLMLAAAMGETMETLTGMRLGVIAFNSLSGNVAMYDADSTVDTSNRKRVAGIFYEANGSGGTPTRETLNYIGQQYKRTDQTSGKYNVVQYSCQRNNAFIVTDGFANASAVSVPSWDSGKSAATWGTGAPYETMYASSLADLALRYYTNNPRSDLGSGAVPATTRDLNTDLHINTYGLALGARGTLFLSESTPQPTTASAWPNPSANRSPTSVDDLWHATINGRGRMYLANTPEETAVRIRSGLDDMKNQVGAQTSVAVSSFNLLASDGQAYEASYNPAGWTGDLTASAVNNTNGTIAGTPTWSASTVLTARNWSTRVVFTSNGTSGGGIGFTSANVGSTVNPDSATYSSSGVIDYLRGNRAGEGTTYRTRTSLLGAVINAEPVVDIGTGVVYLASGEGMLHAFNTTTGAEEWAYVPYAGLTSIGQTIDRGYTFKTKLDGTPTIGTYAGGKLLVAGMGAAARSYYALDVTSPKGLDETSAAAQVKWTFPSPSQGSYAPYVGYTTGRPLVVKTLNDGYVALVTSGYDNGNSIGDGKGRMWMLNASTGAVIREFVTTAGAVGAEAGLAQIAAYRNDDGTARYVYGGDLLGNLWKFDLNTGTTTLLAVLKNGSGATQPITTRPQLTKINNTPVVMVGTGRMLDITDFGSSSVQSIYAIADGTYLANARTALTPLQITSGTVSASVTMNWNTSRGWYLDLPAGQQVNVDPKFVLGWLHVNANTAGGSNCTQSSNNYRIGVLNASGDTTLLSTTANSTSPVVVQANDNLYRWVRLNDGTIINTQINDTTPITARKNAWREIAR